MRAVLRILLVLALIGSTLWLANRWSGNRLGSMVAWGKPHIEETFTDSGWHERWGVYEGGFEVREGRLVSTGAGSSTLLLRQQMSGPVAVEFTGRYVDGTFPCDLSLIYYSDVEFTPRGTVAKATPLYKLQVGAYDNSFSSIIEKSGRYLGYSDYRIDPNKELHLRFEIADTRLRILADGKEIISSEVSIPVPSGWVGLYGHYAGKAFDNVRVFRQRLDSQVPATAVADWLAQQAQYDRAADEYARVANELGQGGLGDRARWLRAVCLDQIQDPRTPAAWAALKGTAYADRAEAAALEERFRAGDHQGIFKDFPAVYHRASPSTRTQLANAWSRWSLTLRRSKTDPNILNQYADLHCNVPDLESITDREAAELFLYLGRAQDVVDHLPEQRSMVATALMRLGYAERGLRYLGSQRLSNPSVLGHLGYHEEILRDGPPYLKPRALSDMGRYEELVERFPDALIPQALALQQLQRYDELLTKHPDLIPICIDALIFMGRYEEALAMAGDDKERQFQFAIRTGDLEAAQALSGDDPGRLRSLRWALAIQAWGHGDRAPLDEIRSQPMPAIWHEEDAVFIWLILFNAQEALDGDGKRFAAAVRGALADREEPWKTRVPDWLRIIETGSGDGDSQRTRLLAALHHDLAGRPDEARAAYQAALGPDQRRAHSIFKIFMQARLARLTATPQVIE